VGLSGGYCFLPSPSLVYRSSLRSSTADLRALAFFSHPRRSLAFWCGFPPGASLRSPGRPSVAVEARCCHTECDVARFYPQAPRERRGRRPRPACPMPIGPARCGVMLIRRIDVDRHCPQASKNGVGDGHDANTPAGLARCGVALTYRL
jgi:hypothetical protein